MCYVFCRFLSLSNTGLYIILGVSALLGTILYFVLKYYWNRVIEGSYMLKELYNLNTSYKFFTGIKKTERINKACNSKSQYDKINPSTYFMAVIENEIKYYDDLINKIESNQMLFMDYSENYTKLKSVATKEIAHKYKMPLFVYKTIEKSIFRKMKLNPRRNTEFTIRVTYVSPKGKNAYQHASKYNLAEAKNFIYLVHMQLERKKTKQYQRTIMSDNLRYQVLHRDGFKCQLCGVSAKDGAKLHVDHITPVSKGGKTEISNLRTLCDRCNLGKRDKIE